MTEKPEDSLIVDTDDLIARLSSNDCKVAEQAFEELCRRIGDVKSRIYFIANRENDCVVLSYLVELLGESKDPKYYPFIARQLDSDHPKVRFFAHNALLRLGTPQSLARHYSCDLRTLLAGALGGKKES